MPGCMDRIIALLHFHAGMLKLIAVTYLQTFLYVATDNLIPGFYDKKWLYLDNLSIPAFIKYLLVFLKAAFIPGRIIGDTFPISPVCHVSLPSYPPRLTALPGWIPYLSFCKR